MGGFLVKYVFSVMFLVLLGPGGHSSGGTSKPRTRAFVFKGSKCLAEGNFFISNLL